MFTRYDRAVALYDDTGGEHVSAAEIQELLINSRSVGAWASSKSELPDDAYTICTVTGFCSAYPLGKLSMSSV